jgi:hypothetical protein
LFEENHLREKKVVTNMSKNHQETNHTGRKPKPSVAGFTEEIPKNRLRTVRIKI